MSPSASCLLGVCDLAECQMLLERQIMGNPSLMLTLEELLRWVARM
jgi:hypothetical protein